MKRCFFHILLTMKSASFATRKKGPYCPQMPSLSPLTLHTLNTQILREEDPPEDAGLWFVTEITILLSSGPVM